MVLDVIVQDSLSKDDVPDSEVSRSCFRVTATFNLMIMSIFRFCLEIMSVIESFGSLLCLVDQLVGMVRLEDSPAETMLAASYLRQEFHVIVSVVVIVITSLACFCIVDMLTVLGGGYLRGWCSRSVFFSCSKDSSDSVIHIRLASKRLRIASTAPDELSSHVWQSE